MELFIFCSVFVLMGYAECCYYICKKGGIYMSGKFRFILVMTSIILLFNGISVTSVFASSQEVSVEYEHYDINRLKDVLSHFSEECKVDNNEESIYNAYISILNEYDRIYAMASLSMIQYYAELSDKNMNEYTYSSVLGQTALNMIVNTLQDAYNNTQYSELIKNLSGVSSQSSQTIYDTDMSVYQEKEMEIQQKYLQIRQQNYQSADQTDHMVAELYIEYAKLLTDKVNHIDNYDNYWTYIYDVYNRDYTTDDIKKLSSSLKQYLKQYFSYSVDCYRQCDYIPESSDTLVFDNNIQVLRKYAGKISDEAAQSAAMIDDNNLYIFGGGKTSRDMTFTTYLFHYDVPYLYQYIKNNNYDLHTTIHEFGHFNAMYHPSEYVGCTEITGNCLDIAELQSQGMSVMFTSVYDEIYGRYSKTMKLYELYNLIHTVAMAFLVNDIEEYVFENIDTVTADDILEKFSQLKNEYQIVSTRLSSINHIFEMPFYYISYGVSALAAFELWDQMNCDYDRAMEMYTEFSHVNGFNTDNKFISSLKNAGFSVEIFNCDSVVQTIENVVCAVSGERIYGDTDNSGSVTVSDVVYLYKRILDSDLIKDENDLKRCDLNKDSQIDIMDYFILKKMFV